EDLRLCVERHSTSKIKTEADLVCIPTLGFRGEALPSMASVAKMQIVSRPGSAEFGHRLAVEGARKGDLTPAAAALGTTVEIRDIFFNTPARKKFLKSPATELSHVCDAVNRMALAQSAVHFRLFHDGRTIADYSPATGDRDRLYQVLGREIAKALIPFSSREGASKISGYLSAVPSSFPNTRYLLTYVNKRYVRDKVLSHGVLHGYENLLMKGQYPAVVLFLDVPFSEVDVNVHPAKYEVRFRRQSEIHEAVASAVRLALRREAKEPSARSPWPQRQPVAAVLESPLPYTRPAVTRVQPPGDHEAFANAHAEKAAQDGFFSSMMILGQILGCYLVCSSADGLALIDQHAAHERVAFEKLRRQMAMGTVTKQALLIPQAVELSAGEVMLLEQRLAELERMGFLLEPFGPDSYAITAVPSLLPEGDYRKMVRQMIAELAEIDNSDRLRQHLEERLATIACHSVIRANRKLAPDEIRALLSELDQIDFATQCPHGRPVLIEFRREQLERMFKRV
ncbi:MAG TPA: DNA mismatch repair endonuclease MutL, partial [Candidatus Binatia bacterium]|nr:DNA mismatch repair endonuclease MutL [Candidatus Binatia bacterium]